MPVSKGLIEKLEEARRGQGHAKPGASAEKVIEAALDLLLPQQAPVWAVRQLATKQ